MRVRSRHGTVAALDIGSTKICCFIARQKANGELQVAGIGHQASRGVRGGMIVGMDEAEAAILNAVHAAEEMAGETVDRVFVNLTGGYPASLSIGVEITLNGHEVGDGDLRRAFRQAQHLPTLQDQEERGRQLIHTIPLGYTIDGSRGIRDPRGMYGDHLGVNMHMITASTAAVRNIMTCVERCHLDVSGFVVSSYAAGLSSLVDDEIDLGVTLVDMGGGSSTIAVFYEGNIIYSDVVPIGGNHVTHDIARGLSTPIAHAERMKTLYGHALATPSDEHELIDVPQVGEEEADASHQVPRSLLVGIIQPRVEETFELVRSRLEASGMDRIAGRRVVLTGGASQLSGLRELGSLVLDKQIRIGRPVQVGGLAEATAGPAFATAAGLLLYGANVDEIAPSEIPEEAEMPNGFFGKIGEWLRDNF